jgi:hypothetical protein
METRPRLVVLTGGRPANAPARRRLPRSALRVVRGGVTFEVERALADAVAAARQMRREIEQRIAQALDGFDGGKGA